MVINAHSFFVSEEAFAQQWDIYRLLMMKKLMTNENVEVEV